MSFDWLAMRGRPTYRRISYAVCVIVISVLKLPVIFVAGNLAVSKLPATYQALITQQSTPS